jgi:transcriptional regulator with XRE-family HTH domain
MLELGEKERVQRFGEYLRELRGAEGLRQSQVSESSGVSTPYVSALERGAKNIPSRMVIRKLAKAFTKASYEDLLRAAGYSVSDLPEFNEPPRASIQRSALPDVGMVSEGRSHASFKHIRELFEMSWRWVMQAPDSATKKWLDETLSEKAKIGFIVGYQEQTGRVLLTQEELLYITDALARPLEPEEKDGVEGSSESTDHDERSDYGSA